MNRRTIGILAGVIGSALSALYWARHRAAQHAGGMTPARERGTVIFDNTPAAPDGGLV